MAVASNAVPVSCRPEQVGVGRYCYLLWGNAAPFRQEAEKARRSRCVPSARSSCASRPEFCVELPERRGVTRTQIAVSNDADWFRPTFLFPTLGDL